MIIVSDNDISRARLAIADIDIDDAYNNIMPHAHVYYIGAYSGYPRPGPGCSCQMNGSGSGKIR
eukprot:SAG22_NODE_157_length_16986_cov_17.230177_9_plen_64_part_00